MSQDKFIIAPDISLRIQRLKAFSILLVVMTHSSRVINPTLMDMSGFDLFVSAVFFNNIGHLCITFFFAVSGYLFFLKPTSGFDGYLLTLRKKFRSVLLPMLLFNGALYVYLVYVGSIPNFGGKTVALQKGLMLGVLGLWGHPINYSLWFLRDLFLLFACYPLLVIILSEVPWTGFFALFGLWHLVSSPVDLVSLVFFYFGALLAVTKVDLHAAKRLTLLTACAYLGCLIALGMQAAATGVLAGNLLIYRVGLVIGTILIWQLSEYDFISKSRFLAVLAPCGFMIYLIHEPTLSLAISLLSKFPVLTGPGIVFALQLSSMVLTFFAAWLIAYLLRRFCPPLFALLTGGRL